MRHAIFLRFSVRVGVDHSLTPVIINIFNSEYEVN